MRPDSEVRLNMLAAVAQKALQNGSFATELLKPGNAGEALQDYDKALLRESDGKKELTLGEFKLLRHIAQNSEDPASFLTAIGQKIQELGGDDTEPFDPSA